MSSPHLLLICAVAVLTVSGQKLQDTLVKCECGQVNHDMRTSKGGSSSPLLFPWMVAVAHKDGASFYGGVLINKKEILTSGHCVDRKNPKHIDVILGVHDLGKVRASDRFRVKKIVSHEGYKKNWDGGQKTYDNDIAILTLDKELVPAPNIGPICLSNFNTLMANSELTVLGWGKQSADGKITKRVLQMLSYPEKIVESCGALWNKTFHEKNTICMGELGHNICEGDYGGPLQVRNWSENRVDLIGIASTSGPQCGDIFPGVYTKFESVRQWVKDKSQFYSECYK